MAMHDDLTIEPKNYIELPYARGQSFSGPIFGVACYIQGGMPKVSTQVVYNPPRFQEPIREMEGVRPWLQQSFKRGVK